jgi:hypothetical protein
VLRPWDHEWRGGRLGRGRLPREGILNCLRKSPFRCFVLSKRLRTCWRCCRATVVRSAMGPTRWAGTQRCKVKGQAASRQATRMICVVYQLPLQLPAARNVSFAFELWSLRGTRLIVAIIPITFSLVRLRAQHSPPPSLRAGARSNVWPIGKHLKQGKIPKALHDSLLDISLSGGPTSLSSSSAVEPAAVVEIDRG